MFKPKKHPLARFYQRLHAETFTYRFIGGSLADHPTGYDTDDNKVLLGEGLAVFRQAADLLQQWKMFPFGWTEIYYPHSKPIKGNPVALRIKLLGKWWYFGSKIVYVLEEPNRVGFAYGTLQSHLERGEELFVIEKGERDQIHYRIRAFSKPDKWYVWLTYPFARAMQRRFVRESLQQMRTLIQEKS